ITKPFAIEELLARIRTALKKRVFTVKKDEDVIRCGLLTLDKMRHKVMYGDTEIELTNREFTLLQILMENKNIVLTRDVLIEKVCGYNYVGETNVIDVYVRYLRTKIDDVFKVKIISTVRGVGYVIKDE
ncbi:MAG: response regulator transcription factor, partial [Clostridium perfringens]|nr:response regulator transcription factor [Clostridium perfringens]